MSIFIQLLTSHESQQSPPKSRFDLISLFSEFASASKHIVHKNINDVACNIILKITIDNEVRLRTHIFKFDTTFISSLLLFCIIINGVFPHNFHNGGVAPVSWSL